MKSTGRSIIRLTIPPVICSVTPALEENTAEVVENTAIARNNTPSQNSAHPPSHVSLQDQKSISKNHDQKSQDSDSSSKNINEENNKKISNNKNTSNCSYGSNDNSFVKNLPRPAVPAATGKNEFTALRAVLPYIIPAAPAAAAPAKEKAKSTASDPSGQVSDKVLNEGKKVLSAKGLDCEIVVNRILTDMCKHNIRFRDRYFLAACKNEKVFGLASSPQGNAPAHPDYVEGEPVKRQVNIIEKMKIWEKEKETEDFESIARVILKEWQR
ncbi:MAG TPA: hypothetical protein PL110_20220 [Candidatus Eremiobacteraeota bacterium]|nr:hypothetical protein [Candidatus Eremiobacteraeota bacterium]